MIYNIIVAIDLNYGIGYKNTIPWYIPDDLKRFSKLTRGAGNNAIIMGRKTWVSLPNGVLEKRDNLILSKSLNDEYFNLNGDLVKTFNNINDIINFCNRDMKYQQVWIIGGEEIYRQFLDKNIVDYVYMTRIQKFYNCDTKFPDSMMWWHCIQSGEETTKDGIKLLYNVYSKKKI